MDGNKYEYGDHITVSKDPESKAKWEVLLKEEKKLLEKIRKSEKFLDTKLDLANLTALMTPDLSRPSSKVVGSSKNTPKTQTPKHAIDDNVRTKYLNYDAKGSGLTIYTSGGIINGLSLTSAEDVPGRDPSAYKLEGSVDGKQFALISQGGVPHFKKEIKNMKFSLIITRVTRLTE